MSVNVVRGEDKVFICKLRKDDGDPFDLTGVTSIMVKLYKASGGYQEITTAQTPAVSAKATYGAFTFTAVQPGITGNEIQLIFNGTQTVQQVVDAWNLLYPLNSVSYTGGAGTVVLTSGNVTLNDGLNAFYPLVLITPLVLGKLQITLTDANTNDLKLGTNPLLIILDFGTHSQGIRKLVSIMDALNVSQFK